MDGEIALLTSVRSAKGRRFVTGAFDELSPEVPVIAYPNGYAP